ncbi:syntaxin-18-like [Ruditapes philippinarum]|uniref:syntaxin-18-like n=1 Tax=Ruditapes philippinarum TaxID=129788 RepID=UPI00295C076C|nr:syntaxin-18-like [Ruditapes philippinarum]
MADITNLFNATIKSLKTRHKAQGKVPKKDEKHPIFPTAKNRGQFETTSKEVVSTITKLKDFLLEHRKDYVNAGSHLTGEASRMTDREREHIDTEAQNIIKKCQDSLNTVKKNAEGERVHPQVKEHRETVLTLINNYLKVVCKIYSEQRAVRVKRVVDKKRISRIEPERRLTRRSSRQMSDSDNLSANAQSTSTLESETKNSKKPARRVPSEERPSFNDSDEEISPEEAQMFEEENKSIFEEMNSLSEEISKIQGKVVEIASLQEIFTEKVLQQEEDIVKIADQAVFTTENIKGGNEEIREAMKKNAGFRVWILFFLLVLTFSLLFLDWYSG